MITPTRSIDLAPWLGSAAGFFELNQYVEQNAVRFSLAIDGIEGAGLSLQALALPALQALVGGVSLVATASIDFTETGTYNFNLGALPGWYAIPVAARVVATTRTATVGPTISIGNGTGVGGSGIDNILLAEQPTPTGPAPSAVELHPNAEVSLVSLATQIQLKVTTGATGGSFTGFVLLVLQLFQLE